MYVEVFLIPVQESIKTVVPCSLSSPKRTSRTIQNAKANWCLGIAAVNRTYLIKSYSLLFSLSLPSCSPLPLIKYGVEVNYHVPPPLPSKEKMRVWMRHMHSSSSSYRWMEGETRGEKICVWHWPHIRLVWEEIFFTHLPSEQDLIILLLWMFFLLQSTEDDFDDRDMIISGLFWNCATWHFHENDSRGYALLLSCTIIYGMLGGVVALNRKSTRNQNGREEK